MTENRPAMPKAFIALATWLRNRKSPLVCLLVMTAVLLVPSVGDAFGFSSKVVSSASAEAFAPTKALDRVYKAYQEFERTFPVFLVEDQEVFLVTSTSNTAITALQQSADIASRLSTEINATKSEVLISTASYFSFKGNLSGLGESYTCFPTAPDFADQNSTHPCNSFIFVVKLSAQDADAANDFVSELIDIGNTLDAEYQPAGYRVVLTGRLTTSQIVGESTGKGFAISDGIGLPFIVLIFYWQVQSWRLLLIPAVALGISLITSYSIGGAMTRFLDIPEFQPNIMLFLCLAFSIDYSFFMLTRFQEERLCNSRSLEESVALMLHYSGGIVLVSGGLLVVTWIALAFFPVSGLDAVGYCSAVSVLVCMLINLLVCPSLIMAFPVTYSNTRGGMCCGFRCCRCCRHYARAEDLPVDVDDIMSSEEKNVKKSPLMTSEVASSANIALEDGKVGLGSANGDTLLLDADIKSRNWYYRMAVLLTRWPWNVFVPLLVYVIFALGCISLKDLNLSLGVQLSFGKSESAIAYSTILEDYQSTGVFQQPFAILALPSSEDGNSTVLSQEYFDATYSLAEALATSVDKLVVPAMQGVSFTVENYVIVPYTATQAQAWVDTSNAGEPLCVEGAAYAYLFEEELSNAEASASVMNLSPSFNPFGTESRTFVKQVRNAIDASMEQQSTVDFYLFHPVVTEVDAEEYTISRFPAVFSGMLCFCFLCIAIRFRAPFIPFKLLLTVIIPILFVFGLAVDVYQYGVLDFLGASQFSKDTGMGTGESGISWLLPVSTVFLLTGLALDYDIFLYSRIYELRLNAHTNRSSIATAVGITGPVISCAGVIMALAFTGMLAGDNKYLNEFGFVMIIGVLLDTFVVRTILVPCILSLGGAFNWWPAEMPEPAIGVEGEQLALQDSSLSY